ncbi:MAG: S8 family serine peptidase [Planctomycetes bacterium]|nr:S8 family serine peptidase [Planctomycetota bacterium]
MSVNNTNKSWLTGCQKSEIRCRKSEICHLFSVLCLLSSVFCLCVAAVQVMAAGTSTHSTGSGSSRASEARRRTRAKLSSAEKDLAVPTDREQRRLARVSSAAGKQKYVSGEVIVKLKDSQSSGISLFSGPYPTTVARHETILLRLQTEYGLYPETSPVFKGVHKRLENQNTPQSQKLGRFSIASAGETTAPAQRLRNAELSRFYLLRTAEDVRTICAQLKKDPEVEYAQPNYIYHSCVDPNDPEFPDQYAHQLIQMSDAWDISTGSHDVVVAVLDTGVDVNHPDLKDNIWVNKNEIPNNGLDDDENGYIDDIHGWNFGDDNNDVTPEGIDWWGINGHGTQVSGVIAAVGNNGEGVSGINWHCSIMALRLSLEFTSAEVAAALDYAAANGAHVLNMSFGADEFGPDGDPIVKEAIDNAFAQGVLLSASAGNDDTTKPNYPAAYYNVMAVASTNGEDIKTGHSSFGTWVDITAPGTDIVTTDLNGKYIATAGTSFSSPYVAAVGALVLAHRPELTHVEVRAILENTTDPVYYGNIDPIQGYIGTGRVNAYQALMAADQRHPLGEIVEPRQEQIFAPDVNSIPMLLFVHGDSYRLEYTQYGNNDWILIDENSAPIDPNGLVHLSFTNPGAGVFELRLSVTTEGSTHTDRKTFGLKFASSQAPWPMQEEGEDADEWYLGSPLCLDVDGDGRNEIVEASVTWSDFNYEGAITIWKDDGTPLPGWPKALGFGLLDSMIASGMAVGDIDGDGDYEIIVVDDYNVMATALHVETGKVVDGDWPVEVGSYWYAYIVGNPILADLDGDGDSEIIIALDAESRESDGLFAIQGDGTFLWQRRYTSEGPMSVADFDGDGDVEIALCGYGPGITRIYTFILDHNGQQIKRWRGGSKKGTVIADLDADGELELVFCTEDSVMAVHIDGSTVWKTMVGDLLGEDGALSIGDIDGDGFSEVYVSSYVEADGFTFSLVHAFDHQGRELSDAGFPKTVMGNASSSPPLIGDIDGDGQKELVVGATGAPIMAWESDGSVTLGFPMLGLSTDVYTSLVLEDLDKDGDIEMMFNGDDYQFHVIDLPGSYDPEMIDWGMARHDPQNSGWASKIPQLDPIDAPDEIRPGERLELTLSAYNPMNVPLDFFVGNLPEGAYYDADTLTVFWKPAVDQSFHTYTFSFLVTDGIRQTSQSVSVTVVPDAIYYANMDTDPGWQLDEGWAWGVPTGQGSWNGDPNSGYTGENVIGYKLDGDYDDNLTDTRYATTGAINCEGYENIRLSFRRWLGVESPYDYADVQVSNDGSNWVDIWTVGYSHVSDEAWRFVEYVVPSSVVDGQPTVYFRWGIGPTDDSVTYPGWNIDDVQATGDRIQGG